MARRLTQEQQHEVDHFWNRYGSFLYWMDRDPEQAEKLWGEVMQITRKLIEFGIIRLGERMPARGS